MPSVESVIAGLSGDKDDIPTDLIIRFAEEAIRLGMPNISGLARYRYQKRPLMQTPLILILNRIKYKGDLEPHPKLDALAKQLLSLGADVSHASNFGCASMDSECYSPPRTCLSRIISFQNSALFAAIPKETLQSSIHEIFTELQVSWGDLKYLYEQNLVYHKEIIGLFDEIPDSEVIQSYLFILLLLGKVLNHSKDITNDVKLIQLSELIRNKLPKDSAVRQRFTYCMVNQTLHPWIAKYPKSINFKMFSTHLAEVFSEDEYNLYFMQLMKHNAMSPMYSLKAYDVRGYIRESSWQDVTKQLILSKETRQFPSKEMARLLPSIHVEDMSQLLRTIHTDPGYKFYNILGRTILYQDLSTQDILAFKIQKKSEDISALEKEASTLIGLHEESQLKSQLPYPICVLKKQSLSQVSQLVPKDLSLEKFSIFQNLVADQKQVAIYCYRVKAVAIGYFIYLHDPMLSSLEFREACRKAIHDLCFLFKKNGLVFSQLADIFHNSTSNQDRTDQGRYLVLVKLIRRFYEVEHSGRVDRWQKAVEFVNLRATGLADVGDSQLFQDFSKSEVFQEITRPFQDRFQNATALAQADEMIYANLLAEYLFIFTLVCGQRGNGLIQQNPSIDRANLWKTLAVELLENAAYLFSNLTGIAEKQAIKYIQDTVSADVLAKQMGYWMTKDYSQQALKKTDLEAMYPGAVLDGWHNEYKEERFGKVGIGFSNDGIHQDLGDYNCANPMTEDNKLYYFIASLVRVFSDMGKKYGQACFDFEKALEEKRFGDANSALIRMEQNTYSHAKWQYKNNLSKKVMLYRLRENPIPIHFPRIEIEETKEVKVEKIRIKEELKQVDAEVNHVKEVKPEPASSSCAFNMMILSGFISIVGGVAVALAFTLLNGATFGTAGLVLAGVGGVMAVGGLVGFGIYANKACKEYLDNMMADPVSGLS